MSSSSMPEITPAWPVAATATATAYALAAAGSLLLAPAPDIASPLYPSAGIALVSVLLFGWRMLPAIWLGSFVANLALMLSRVPFGVVTVAVPAAIGVGAALQAAAGCALVRRFQTMPLTLTEPREVARFFAFGAGLACLVSASVGNAALGIAQVIPPAALGRSWLTWWLGDAIGVLVAAPLVLALIGRPASIWTARRRSVALPLAVVTLLAALAIVQVQHWDDERAQALFERDAASAFGAVRQRLQTPLHALEAMRGLFLGSDDVGGSEFRLASGPWLGDGNSIQAIGWAERVGANALAAFEAAARKEGSAGYAVFDRGPAGERLPPGGAELTPVRFVEPLERNAMALGVNALSVPEAREAVMRARRTDLPAASAGFRLMQERARQTEIVIYRAVYGQSAPTAAARAGATRGVLFVTLRMEDALQPVLAELPPYLELCLIDTANDALQRRLAGAPGCDAAGRAEWRESHDLPFAQRRWQLLVSARAGALPAAGGQGSWLFGIVSLLAVAAFGALLLTMTGRARRIELAVEERTHALQREIGERARTEAALRDSEQRLRNILNHVPIGVIYCDLQGYIQQSNPQFRELVGYGAEELSELRPTDFTHAEDRDGELELRGRLMRGEIPVYQRQLRYVRRDGGMLWVRVVVSLLRDAEGEPHRIVAVVEDISEHLALRRAEDARELAEAANRAKNDFLSRMSHELRTPLNAMLGFAQLVEIDPQRSLSAQQREWVSQIQTAGWHLLEMINDTLDLSRIESGTLKLDFETMELPPVVAAAISMLERAAEARGISVTQSLAPNAAQVYADATRVKQILTNLVSNAVKYNVEGGVIRIASRIDADGAVELSVSDTGLGMSPGQLGALFQPFNRLGRERSQQEGTGIGLVISQRLAELMGGSLSARSTEGEGSTFVLTLPRASRREPPPEASEEDSASRPRDYRQRVVHYIEDNETNAVVMEGILAQRPQVRLRISPNGLDALAAIRSAPPSLILLDMHLPDIDGLQLLRMLKDVPDTASVPVVVVSADAVSTRVKAALDAGAERYLTKPINVAELLRLLDELLEQRDTLFG
jgi:PAS domain S-box-containing protein